MKVLTKSRFKLGLECPNKLFFTSKDDYANNKKENPFMEALAEGGFQVEELARLQYPSGVLIDVEHFEYEKAVELTNKELQKENVIIYEAAFLYDGLFIRTDVLVKARNKIKLIEVKAKSYNPNEEYTFIGKQGKIVSGWKPYLFDLAFQKYVVHKAFPDFTITAHLMLVDKTKNATVDGLNQMFRIPKQGEGNQRTDIIKRFNSVDELGESILIIKNVDDIIEDILTNKHMYHDNLEFEDAVKLFRDAYQDDKFLNWDTNFTACKNCEFKVVSEKDIKEEKKSGFEYCFRKLRHWNDEDFKKHNAFEIWDLHYKKGIKFMSEDKLFLTEITEDDLNVKPVAGKISHSERQMLQVEKSRDNDKGIFYLKEELQEEMDKWKFPLHFIDFETSAVALPFHKGRRPYEQGCFPVLAPPIQF